MDVKELKEYLIEDKGRIEKVLEAVGCHQLWETGDEIRACPPEGSNKTAVSVKIDSLYCTVYTSGETFRGDIIGLVQHFRDEDFKESFRFIASLFGLSTGKHSKAKVDPLAIFKTIRRQAGKVKDINDIDIKRFNRSILNDFVLLPHINLFYEGIMPSTAEHFSIGYDSKLDRIIFPHFAYDDINTVVGITGRTLRSKEDMEMFDIPKYWNYIKGYKKMYNLYGFSHNKHFIDKDKIMFVFEAEKSVLKESTMTRDKGHGVGLGGHELSDMQVQIILQNTTPDTEIVIAFDKDVMEMEDDDGNKIGEKFLIDTCNKLSKYRKVSYIWDNPDFPVLGEKDSPIDKGYKIWQHLVKFRKVV